MEDDKPSEKQPLFLTPLNSGLTTACKILIPVAIAVPTILFLVVLFVLVGLVANGSFNARSDHDSVCTTPSCVELGATVLRNMNISVDPCEDFYNYSCGGWEARNTIPSGYGSYSLFSSVSRNNIIQIQKLLTGSFGGSIDAVDRIRTVYSSCMDLDELNKLGSSPLVDIVNFTGGWDLVGINNGSAPKWALSDANYLASVAHGNPAFFQFSVSVDDKNSSQYVATLEQSGLSLPSREAYLEKQNETAIPALRQYITSTLSLLDPTANSDTISEAANQIIDFETELAKIFVDNVALRNIDASYNPYKLNGNLSDGSLWKQFNWASFINSTFKSAGVKIDEDLIIIVRTPTYFTNLSTVYGKFNETVIENYFKWKLVAGYISLLGEDFLNNYYAFTQATVGSGKVDRYLTCISLLEDIVPFTVARLYTDYVLPEGTRGNVSAMIKEIKDAFEARLEENPWLDDVTRERSKWKVGNITSMIAYPDGIYNDTVLSLETEPIEIEKGSLFFSSVLFAKRGYEENLKLFGKPVDKTTWDIAPTVVNAYYQPYFNMFVFLEGILNAPFFAAGWPYYFNYGAFGVVIGHELTHGFDDQGQRYNQHGVLTPWWTKHSIDEFNERKACFVEQYSKYSMFGYNINGNLTLGENIADNGGVKTAYQAFKTVSKDKKLPNLPGIDLSPDELFFVAFGQVWCSLFTPGFLQSNLVTNPHSPGPYRVIGALSNSEDFASVFKCPVGSRMNPSKKCDLW